MPITTNASELAETFRQYAQLRSGERDIGYLATKQALQLVIGSRGYDGMYQITRAASPDQSKIAADVQRQGWKIPEKFPDGRLGRGTPDQWIGTAIKALPKKRGRKSKARLGEEETIRSSKPTLEMMQAFVIKNRTRAIGYVATGFLGAARALGGDLPSDTVAIRTIRGKVEFSFGENSASVTIVNNTPGITYMNSKYQIARRAIAERVKDMMEFITRELKTRAQSVGWRAT